jgi:hypothetical protein
MSDNFTYTNLLIAYLEGNMSLNFTDIYNLIASVCPVEITVNNTNATTNETINNTYITEINEETRKALSHDIAIDLPIYMEEYQNRYNTFMHPVLLGYTLPMPYWSLVIGAVFLIICTALGCWTGLWLLKKTSLWKLKDEFR